MRTEWAYDTIMRTECARRAQIMRKERAYMRTECANHAHGVRIYAHGVHKTYALSAHICARSAQIMPTECAYMCTKCANRVHIFA